MYKKKIGKVLISPPPQKVKGNFTKNMRKKIEKNCSHLAGSRIRKAFYYTRVYVRDGELERFACCIFCTYRLP